jgi:5-methylcytosine-specific restriction protein B
MMFIKFGHPRRYWKVGTTEGSDGASHWDGMRGGQFVSIGWPGLPDLSERLGNDKATLKNLIRGSIERQYSTAGMASRKAGEIVDFVQTIQVEDLVLACSGSSVLGIGKVNGPYQYDESLEFPHKRPVEWLSLEPWTLPEVEGPRTTVFPFGNKELNRLEFERRLSRVGDATVSPQPPTAPAARREPLLPALDAFTARLESILQRKGQVILYGPPGTGKTFRAVKAANELAARSAFGRTLENLSAEQSAQIIGSAAGIVRMCTFHPGWGYEDFMEGLRPVTHEGRMLFEARDGIFKVLCADAVKSPKRKFYLVIDEINRGDLPRIFGELITTIEYDKRERPIKLPITGVPFSVPKNVFLIGTMNTADRSISLMDAALRRRFGFIELMPDSSLLAGRRAGELPLGAWLDALNARLLLHLKRDARNLQVGHSYLMSLQANGSLTEFGRVLRDDIIPLLEEYCYSDFGALQAILGDKLVDVEAGRIKDELFDPKWEDELLEAVSFEEMQSIALMKPEEAIVYAPADSDSDDEENLGGDEN